jgi:hypothetical protein
VRPKQKEGRQRVLRVYEVRPNTQESRVDPFKDSDFIAMVCERTVLIVPS